MTFDFARVYLYKLEGARYAQGCDVIRHRGIDQRVLSALPGGVCVIVKPDTTRS